MEQPIFQGVCTALVTPFLDESVNYPMLERLVKHQIDAGVSAVVLAGTTGEAPTLTDEEKITMFSRVKNYTADNCTVICGTGSNSTAHAVALSVAAEEAGADALLIVSPYYNKATEDGLVAHYMSIAHAVNIPIILYNVPGRTGLDIPVSVYRRLSYIPNIVGVKEAGSDITKIIRIQNECPADFCVWSGNDAFAVPTMALGGKGVISVVSNIFPKETVAMANAALDGDFDTAADLQCKLQPMVDLLFSEVNPVPVKAAMQYIGFDCGICRLPLTDASENTKQRLKNIFT